MLCLSLVAAIAFLLVGLQARLVWQTTIAVLILLGLGDRLVQNPLVSTEKLMATLYRWGMYLTVLGLCLEPYEGGIKKDSATLSYLLMTTGISVFLLILSSVAIDLFNLGSKLKILIDNGRNPMMAYVGFGNLILPIVNLSGLQETLVEMEFSVFKKVILAIVYTLSLAILVSGLTRLKLVWRT